MKNVSRLTVLLLISLLSAAGHTDDTAKSAVTHILGGGRFGDQLIGYLHAKWISYRHNMPLLYHPFPYSDQLALHHLEKHVEESDFQRFENVIRPGYLETVDYRNDVSTLYALPYFPEPMWEHTPQQHGLHDVFHMEYDNMLYAELDKLLPVFQSRYQGIGATFDNDGRCIPGFMYIKNSESMNRLAKTFSDHAKENLFDMQLIAAFKNENPETVIDHLPIITREYIAEHPLVTPSGLVAANKGKYALNIDAFASIFDAAALGQFLGGIDPRNDVSKPGFINESCVFNPSLIQIEWIVDEQGRRAPYVVYPHAKYRINNLHIHSKFLERFMSKEAL